MPGHLRTRTAAHVRWYYVRRMADHPEVNIRFLAGVDAWIGVLGRLRDVVRQHVLAAQLAEVLAVRGPGLARVLDVGCGQGTQALLLARAGHEVTGLDISADLLTLFESQLSAESAELRSRVQLVLGPGEAAADLAPGPFDLILCHGVLPYFDDVGPLLSTCSAVAAGRATLSLLVRNGLAPAMRAGLRGHWADAVASFDSGDYTNRLGLAVRAHSTEDFDQLLHGDGWRPYAWYGVRILTDHREDDELPPPDELALLLAAEREAGGRDPYRQVAALLHIVYTRD